MIAGSSHPRKMAQGHFVLVLRESLFLGSVVT